MPGSCIEHCFNHCFRQERENKDDNTEQVRLELRDQTVRDFNDHGVSFKRIALQSVLNPVGENELTEILTIENQGEFIASVESMEKYAQGSDAENALCSFQEELKDLAVTATVAGSVLERLGRMDKCLLNGSRECQKEL